MVVGVDEVGRGAWAGPISVGAAVLPPDRRVYKVRDSKALTEPEREAMFDRLAGWCTAWAVGHASAAECDGLGMAEAQRLAARRAIAGLGVDARRRARRRQLGLRRRRQPAASSAATPRCLSIATASILAKVTRDRIMRAEAEHFPALRAGQQQGLPLSPPQGGAAGLGPVRDPPADLGVHGPPALAGPPAAPPARRAGGRRRLPGTGRRSRIVVENSPSWRGSGTMAPEPLSRRSRSSRDRVVASAPCGGGSVVEERQVVLAPPGRRDLPSPPR